LAGSERWEVAFAQSSWREIVLRDKANDVAATIEHARGHGVLAGLPLGTWYPDKSDCLMIAVTEKRTRAEIDQLIDVLNHAPSVSGTCSTLLPSPNVQNYA
jgi:glycine dehydrogenase subunit 1